MDDKLLHQFSLYSGTLLPPPPPVSALRYPVDTSTVLLLNSGLNKFKLMYSFPCLNSPHFCTSVVRLLIDRVPLHSVYCKTHHLSTLAVFNSAPGSHSYWFHWCFCNQKSIHSRRQRLIRHARRTCACAVVTFLIDS